VTLVLPICAGCCDTGASHLCLFWMGLWQTLSKVLQSASVWSPCTIMMSTASTFLAMQVGNRHIGTRWNATLSQSTGS
jgi:hypothetical protein